MKIRFSRKQIPLFVLIGFGILLFGMGILNHYFFRTVTFDYGNYNFAFWDYSHFRISPMPTYPGNFLQDHFSFTLMYFVPVYWLINWITGTYTLILIQYTLILIAAWYTYKLVLLKSENIWLSIGVLIYYFTLLGRYTTYACDTNIAVMSACFIPVFIYYFEIRKYWTALIILMLSLLSRENIPIWFIFIFIVLIIQHRQDKKAVIYSLVGISISIVYFILMFKVFIPSIETAEKKFTLFNYAALGENPGEAIAFIVKHPVETFKLFFINHLNDPAANGVKAEFYWVYLISGGFILFLRPKYLIWFIPLIAQKELNDSYIRWGISTYYSIEVVTLLPLSVFLALSSIRLKWLQNGLIIAVCIATLSTTIYKLNPLHCVIPWTTNPAKEKIISNRFWTTPYNVKKVNELLSMIPAKAKVSASDHIFSHLTQRQSIYFFPTVNDAEYIVFSVFDDSFLISHYANELSRNKYFNDPEWEMVAKEFPVFLFKRKGISQPAVKEINIKTDTLLCNFENIDNEKRHILFNNGEKADTIKYLSSDKALSGEHSIMLSPENPYSTSLKISDINKVSYLQISVWSFPGQDQSNIVATNGKNFYMISNEGEAKNESGWRKIILGFWIPKDIDVSRINIYLWNSGAQPAYYDDLQIIKKYMN